ncbi:MAG: hypothetical protein AB7G21_10005 [Dehalococcoidia bacterium]
MSLTLPRPTYMQMACAAGHHELIAEDWDEAQLTMWQHHLEAHRDIATLGFSAVVAGDVFPYHTERGGLTAEQQAHLQQMDRLIAARS